MFISKHKNILITYVYLIYLSINIAGLEIIKGNNINTILKILDFVNEKAYYEENVDDERKDPISEDKNEKKIELMTVVQTDANKEDGVKQHHNRIVIKRVIPHGYKSGKIEYDKVYKTFYKPLFRIHKHNPKSQSMEFDENENRALEIDNTSAYTSNVKELDNAHKYEGKVNKIRRYKINRKKPKGKTNFIKLVRNSEEMQKPYKTKLTHVIKDAVTAKELIDDINKLLKRTDTKYPKANGFKRKLLKAWDKSNIDNIVGRNLILDRTLEQEWYTQPEETATTKKPSWFPYYSIWNYWTHKKGIQHDECPEQQIKVGNVCIWTPPH